MERGYALSSSGALLGQMKILDRYILGRFLKAFFFISLMLILVIATIDFAERIDDYGEHKDLSAWSIVRYYISFGFFILSFAMPLVVFVTTVFTTSRMASHSEVIAMMSSGITFGRFLFSFLAGSVLLAGLSFVLLGWVMPTQNVYRVAFELAYIRDPLHFTERHIYFRMDEETYLYLSRYDNSNDKAYTVVIDKIEDQRLTSRLQARSMQWDSLSGQWRLYRWSFMRYGLHEDVWRGGKEMDTTLALTPKDFTVDYGVKDMLNLGALVSHISHLEQRGASALPYKVEYYARFMQPFALILLTFLGVVISARKRREGAPILVVIGFLFVFVYIIFFVLAKSMAEVGSLPRVWRYGFRTLSFL